MDLVNEGFEDIIKLIIEEQQRIQRMVAENQRLREEVAALRRGDGIMVVIEGHSVPLVSLLAAAEPQNTLR